MPGRTFGQRREWKNCWILSFAAAIFGESQPPQGVEPESGIIRFRGLRPTRRERPLSGPEPRKCDFPILTVLRQRTLTPVPLHPPAVRNTGDGRQHVDDQDRRGMDQQT